jgi:hypothetical protein
MSVYQLKTFSDLVTAIREECGIQSSDTTAINRIKRDLNIIYQEVVGKKRWGWLSGQAELQVPAVLYAGTVAVTNGSASVTFTVAPGPSKKGYLFAIDGWNEIFTIESHTAGSTTAKLATEWTGSTNTAASYKVWTDKLPLPTSCKDVTMVWHDHYSNPLDDLGRQEFIRQRQQSFRAEGKPSKYFVSDYVDPQQNSSIDSLPAISTRASAGVVKTVVFASGLPATIVTKVSAGEPVQWRFSKADHPSYNGDFTISTIGTTSVQNDTLTYVAPMEYQESATADSNLTIQAIDAAQEEAKHRELYIWPAINTSRVNLHVDYEREALPLENDSDEPIIPYSDRVVLLYGGLSRTWSRLRNPEEAARNLALYNDKWGTMAGKLQETLDKPKLMPSRSYLGAKRSTTRSGQGQFAPPSGGSSGAQSVSGSPSTVATFNEAGELEGSSTISTTELSYLNGASSNIQTQIDAATAAHSAHLADTADAHDASAISVLDTDTLYAASDVEAALAEVMTGLNTHVADSADAHDASAVSVEDTGALYAATEVEAALAEVMTAHNDHVADSSGAHAASAVSFTPTGSIAATDAQAALEELDTEKVAKSGDTMTGSLVIEEGTPSPFTYGPERHFGINTKDTGGEDALVIRTEESGTTVETILATWTAANSAYFVTNTSSNMIAGSNAKNHLWLKPDGHHQIYSTESTAAGAAAPNADNGAVLSIFHNDGTDTHLLKGLSDDDTVKFSIDKDGTATFNGVTSNLTGDVTGNADTATTAGNVTGTVAVTNGGTGLTTATTGDIIYASAANTLAKLGIGSAGQVLKVSGGIPAWQGASASLAVASKTTTYTATSSDDVITVDGSGGAWTLTLPAAASNTGKVFYIKRTDNTPANAVTIDGNASETIDGSTTYPLYTQNESVVIVSDGTNWQVIDHKTITAWTSYTPASYQGLGTPSNVSFFWRRNGQNCEVLGRAQAGTVTAVEARIDYPTGVTSNSTVVPATRNIGMLTRNQVNASSYYALAGSGLAYFMIGLQDVSRSGQNAANGATCFNSSDIFTVQLSVPVTNWKE